MRGQNFHEGTILHVNSDRALDSAVTFVTAETYETHGACVPLPPAFAAAAAAAAAPPTTSTAELRERA